MLLISVFGSSVPSGTVTLLLVIRHTWQKSKWRDLRFCFELYFIQLLFSIIIIVLNLIKTIEKINWSILLMWNIVISCIRTISILNFLVSSKNCSSTFSIKNILDPLFYLNLVAYGWWLLIFKLSLTFLFVCFISNCFLSKYHAHIHIISWVLLKIGG